VSAPVAPSRLRELRLERGWTQQQVADKVSRLAWSRRQRVGIAPDMVSKWERGDKGISPRYRMLLADTFRVTVDQLDLPSTARGASPAADQAVIATFDQAAELLAQLGRPGQAIRPQVLAALTEDVLTRRAMLAAADATPATHPVTAGPDELDQLADSYDQAHATADPAALMTALTAHLRMVGDALRDNPAADTRQRLLRNRARVAILAGRIAADDTGNPLHARGYYAQAIDDAREIGDHQIAAVAHGCAGRLAATEGLHAAALHHSDAAVKLYSGAPEPIVGPVQTSAR
jgi:transcriptional regulator with XRE-family HTH domain